MSKFPKYYREKWEEEQQQIWEARLAEKEKLIKTGCQYGHCYHAKFDPTCKEREPGHRNKIDKCCRCEHE